VGWRYRVGKGLDEAMQGLLRWRVPGSRVFPPGHVFAYDVARLYTFEQRPGPQVIVDVGANVGDVALHLRRWFPGAAIHAIEPISATFRTLQERTRHDPNITCHQLALGAAAERREIVLRKDSELNTLVSDPSIAHATSGARETVAIDTLDAFSILVTRLHVFPASGEYSTVASGALPVLVQRTTVCPKPLMCVPAAGLSSLTVGGVASRCIFSSTCPEAESTSSTLAASGARNAT